MGLRAIECNPRSKGGLQEGRISIPLLGGFACRQEVVLSKAMSWAILYIKEAVPEDTTYPVVRSVLMFS